MSTIPPQIEHCQTECEVVDLPSPPGERALLERASRLVEPYSDLLQGIKIWDIHGHVGCDLDGSHLTAAQLLESLDAVGAQKTVVFPMNDPQQGSCFRHPNDLIWTSYEHYPHRLIPFFRLNPNFPSREEYELRVSQGFQGIKLHPRSQSFRIAQPEAMQIYGWAEGDGLPVLVHTGEGASEITKDVRRVVDEHPSLRLILGHAAAHELRECCAQCYNCDWVLFDTSTLDRAQLRELLAIGEPHKIAYGSDLPFQPPGEDLLLLLETAVEVGLGRAELELILGGNLRRWLTGEPVCRVGCPMEAEKAERGAE
jgi:predicted TIM-barrel fold metal-dependent hydrolase